MSRGEGVPRAVFDCMVLLQGAARSTGPAAACLKLVEEGKIELCVSPQVLAELQDVFARPKVRRRFSELTDERIREFLLWLEDYAILMTAVPPVIEYPRDPKDEPYLNLALAAGAEFLISRDLDLLDLSDDTRPASQVVRSQIAGLRRLSPVALLRLLAMASERPGGPDHE